MKLNRIEVTIKLPAKFTHTHTQKKNLKCRSSLQWKRFISSTVHAGWAAARCLLEGKSIWIIWHSNLKVWKQLCRQTIMSCVQKSAESLFLAQRMSNRLIAFPWLDQQVYLSFSTVKQHGTSFMTFPPFSYSFKTLNKMINIYFLLDCVCGFLICLNCAHILWPHSSVPL